MTANAVHALLFAAPLLLLRMGADAAAEWEMETMPLSQLLRELCILLPLPLVLLVQAFIPALRRAYTAILRRLLQLLRVRRLLAERAGVLAAYAAWSLANVGLAFLCIISSFFDDYYIPELGIGIDWGLTMRVCMWGAALVAASLLVGSIWLIVRWCKLTQSRAA